MSPSGSDATVAAAQTVLVVDSEVLVRINIAAYLRDCGYRVLEASDAAEAVTVLGEPTITVDVVLADVSARGDTDGFALARWARSQRPGVEVVLAASPARAAEAAGRLCDQGPMLARPYDPQQVLDRIRRQLARRRPPGETPD